MQHERMPFPAKHEPMTARQFDAIAKLTGSHTAAKTTLAARMVLVDGIDRETAAEKHGIMPHILRNRLYIIRKRMALARTACGLD